MPRDLGLARYLDCVKSRTSFRFFRLYTEHLNVLGGSSHQVHFHLVRTTRHRVRTTRGNLHARSDSGIKLNKRLIRIFFLDAFS